MPDSRGPSVPEPSKRGSVRDWIESRDGGKDAPFAERSRLLNANIDAVRAEDTPRNRAVLALARLDAEYVGVSWDGLPWDSGSWESDQRHYVMGAMSIIDYLVEHGYIALEDRRADA